MLTTILERKNLSETILEKITRIDDQIDIVAMINDRGRLIDIVSRDDGIIKDLTAQKKEMMFMEFALQASMNKEYNDEFGKVKFSILQRERVLAFLFYTHKDRLIVVLTSSNVNSVLLLEKLSNIVGFN